MLKVSITMGMMARMRSSVAAVSQVVQPRFEAPVTTKSSIWIDPASSVLRNACVASIAAMADFTIAVCTTQSGSRSSIARTHDCAIRSSSYRLCVPCGSSRSMIASGWFGTLGSSTQTDPVASASWSRVASSGPSLWSFRLPPEMSSIAVCPVACFGQTIWRLCVHSGCETSSAFRQVWLWSSRV